MQIYTHTASSDAQSWQASIQSLTDKPSNFKLSKTLVFKPKTGKGAPTQLVMVLSFDDATFQTNGVAKAIGFKEMRLANEDLLNEWFKVEKHLVSPLKLNNLDSSFKENLIVVIDKKLESLDGVVGFRGDDEEKTVFVKFEELKKSLEESEVKVEILEFEKLAAQTVEKKETGEKKSDKNNKKVESKEEDNSIAKIGIEIKKDDDFAGWYRQVLIKSDMIEYYDVSGCYIYRPWSYSIWRHITAFFDKEITELGVEPAYFPLFVSQNVLEKEKDHIEGFAPEVAWVTKAGSSDLEKPVAIRPTSETVMYPYYAKWIRSYRDLPLRLNQWNSVVRWEFKHPQPFIRTREFLWQEGHTAFLTKEEADEEVFTILDLYRQIYEDYLAVPVIKGIKSEKEKFAGGLYTTTCEGFIPSTGRGIQGATSHCLGQNFSKMFNIEVEDPNVKEGEQVNKLHVWQNSWGISTRSIGVMVMVHSDDKGLVLPPKVANVQVVVIPCGIKVSTKEDVRKKVEEGVHNVVEQLKKAGVRAKSDLRDNYTPGYKFNHWELRGVPVRIELGPNDLNNGSVLSVRRDNGLKQAISMESLTSEIPKLLEQIHSDMFQKAKEIFDSHVIRVNEWNQFVPTLDKKNLVLVPWCERVECEEQIKELSAKSANNDEPEDEKAPSMGAKSLCIPLEQPKENPIVEGVTKCVQCDHFAKRFALFGRSY